VNPSAAFLESLRRRRRALVIGVLNVTPDSFSDGGEHLDCDVAIRRGLELHAQGADVIDVGGEATNPRALPVSVEDELGRVLPVIRGLAAAGIRVSVDTTKAAVARAAVAAGADGLLIEVHNNPEKALSDGPQSLYPEQFDQLMGELRIIAPVLGRSLPLARANASA